MKMRAAAYIGVSLLLSFPFAAIAAAPDVSTSALDKLPRLVPHVQASNLFVTPPNSHSVTHESLDAKAGDAVNTAVYFAIESRHLKPNAVYEARVSHRSTNPASFHMQLISSLEFLRMAENEKQMGPSTSEPAATTNDAEVGSLSHPDLRRRMRRRRLATERLQIRTNVNGNLIIEPSNLKGALANEDTDVNEAGDGEHQVAVLAVHATYEGVAVASDRTRAPVRFNLVLEPLVLGVVPYSALRLIAVLVPVVLMGLCVGVPLSLRACAMVDERWPSTSTRTRIEGVEGTKRS
jgi:hypothetical protein